MLPKLPTSLVRSIRCYSKDFKILQKLMHGKKRKRTGWHDFGQPSNQTPMPKISSLGAGPQKNRRVEVLNKIFMQHITDLMTTGCSSEDLIGLSIEITKVKVGSEFNVINVFWTSHGEIIEEEIKTKLRRAAGELRSELSKLRVIGNVPEIRFVRDKTVGSWASVEALLKVADFGPDFEPQGYNALKAGFDNERLGQQGPESLPPMRQNVLGLDREAIMKRIMSSMSGRKHAQSEPSQTGSSTNYALFDQEAYQKFLLQRKINNDRLAKAQRSESDEYTIEYADDDGATQNLDDDDDYVDDYDDPHENEYSK